MASRFAGARGANFSDLHGKRNCESRAVAFTQTFNAHTSAMQFDDISNDGKTDPKTAVRSHVRAVCLTEPVEYLRQELGLDTFTGIADDDANFVADLSCSN